MNKIKLISKKKYFPGFRISLFLKQKHVEMFKKSRVFRVKKQKISDFYKN